MFDQIEYRSINGRSRLLLAALGCTLASTSPAHAQRESAVSPSAVAPFRVLTELDDGAGMILRLGTNAIDSLRIGPQHTRLRLPVSRHDTISLDLERFDVTTSQTRFLRATPDQVSEVIPPHVVLLRGTVTGEPDSRVFLSLSDIGVTNGYVYREDGTKYFITKPNRGGPRTSEIMVHRADAASRYPDHVPFCGTDRLQTVPNIAERTAGSIATVGALPGAPYLLKVAVDADQEYVELFGGDVAAAEAYIVELIGAVADIYLRDFDVRLRLDFVRTWPAGGEPFGADDLAGFRSHWILNEDPGSYQLVHLLSGRRDLSYGGIAYVSGPCGDSFGISGLLLGSFPTPVDGSDLGNWDITVVAHEMGHNMGTGHTHDAYNPPIDSCASGSHKRGTIMSYCHATAGGLLNIEMRFHARVQTVISGILESGTCIFLDCNDNGQDDFTETTFGLADDANNNKIPDECEDCDANGSIDSDDILAGAPDADGNGIPDNCEADCNGNNIPDEWEIAQSLTSDANGNLIPDACEPDCDANGIADHVDIETAPQNDLDRNTVLDECQDCDANGQSDWLDLLRQYNIYVADRTGFVREFHAVAGVAVQSLGAGALDDPHGVAFGHDRQLYVASHNDDRIVRIDVDTGATSDFVTAGLGGLDGPTDLLFATNGNLLVASRFGNAVLEFDAADGSYVGDFVASGAGGLSGPYGMTFGQDGDLYVADSSHRVLQFSGSTGLFIAQFVSAGSGGLNGARGLAFMPDGRLLVASYNTDSVIQYDDTGASLGVFSIGPAPTGAWGVRVKDDGNVLVSRGVGTIRVIEYDPNGLYLRSLIRGDSALTAATMFAVRPASPTDCNQNATYDVCDVTISGEPDCNENLRPDSCDLADPELNADGDDEVDSCQCGLAEAPSAVVGVVARNRYAAFESPVTSGKAVALRMTLVDIPAPFDTANGSTFFVQEPELVDDPRSAPFWAARLGCEPVYLDWSAHDVVHIYGEEILPRSTFNVQAIDQGCQTLLEQNYSAGAAVDTATAWGDIAEPFDSPGGSPQPNFADIAASVDAFLITEGSVPLVQADLHPGVPNHTTDFNDIAASVSAFLVEPYPFAGPTPCPPSE